MFCNVSWCNYAISGSCSVMSHGSVRHWQEVVMALLGTVQSTREPFGGIRAEWVCVGLGHTFVNAVMNLWVLITGLYLLSKNTNKMQFCNRIYYSKVY